MKQPIKIALILVLILLPVGVVLVYGAVKKMDEGRVVSGEYTELTWRQLRGLNYETGEKTPELAQLDGKLVKIPGFVVPLDDDSPNNLAEFLLVPSPQACVHVPPPPPNQMVMVRMKSGPSPQRSWGPVWAKGQLSIATMNSQYGKISYMLYADGTEPYKKPE